MSFSRLFCGRSERLEDGKGRRKAEEAERGVRLTVASGCGPRMRNFIPILLTFHEVNFHANSSSILSV